MSGFLLMLSFFTRVPIGKWVPYTDERYKSSLVTFPIIGIFIGAFLALTVSIPGITGNIKTLLCILVYIAVTGGIHLDGVADSCDGIFSNRPKERVLEIMKDSHIGAFGVIALILYFMSFYIGAVNLDWKWLLIMPFVGKTMGYFSAGFSRYAREDHGMGYLFIEEIHKLPACLYLVGMSAMAFAILGWTGLIAVFAAFMGTIWLILKTKKVINGQTGDTIGFVIELSQMLFLLTGSAILI